MENTKVIIVTGISGSGREQFCQEYNKIRENCKVYHVGKIICDLAQDNINNPMARENILNLNPIRLTDLRKRAFDQILDDDFSRFERVIIETHAQFLWNRTYENSYDWHYLKGLNADMCVTIIDKPSLIKERQSRKKQWKFQNLDLENILDWQNIEVNTTRGWASLFEKKLYVLPNRQNPIILDSLLENEFIIYLSMPMTDASGRANQRVSDFKEKLLKVGKELTGKPTPIIDPRDIDIETEKGLSERTREAIRRHTVHRDLNWYIPEVTDVVADYPEGINVEISKGVSDECTRGLETGKSVHLICDREKRSPFMDLVTNFYQIEEEFFNFFPGYVKERLEEFRREK